MNTDILRHTLKLAQSRIAHPLPNRASADQRFEDALHSITLDLLCDGTKPESMQLAIHRLTVMAGRGQLTAINDIIEEQLVLGLRQCQTKLPPITIMDACDLLRLSSCETAYRWAVDRLGTCSSVHANEAASLGRLILEGHRRHFNDFFISPSDCVQHTLKRHKVNEDNVHLLEASVTLGRLWLEDYLGRGRKDPDRGRALKDLAHLLEHDPDMPLIPGMGHQILRDLTCGCIANDHRFAAIKTMAHDPVDNEVLHYLVRNGSEIATALGAECLLAIPNALTRLTNHEILDPRESQEYFLGFLRGLGLRRAESIGLLARLEQMHPEDERFIL